MSRLARWKYSLGCVSAVALACSSDAAAPDPGTTPQPSGVAPSASPASPELETNAVRVPTEPLGSMPNGSSDEATGSDLALDPTAPGEPAPVSTSTEDGLPSSPPVERALPELPSVRQEHAVVALAGEIYVLGGFTPDVTSSLQAFNPESNTWRSAANAPFALHHANAAAIDGRLMVAGFYIGASFTLVNGRVLQYDPALDTWTMLGLMPAGSERASACVATLGNTLYLFGGARLGGAVTDASAYDVANDRWEELPPLPEPREHCVAAEIGGQLIIAGGRSGGIADFQANTWAFDPDARIYTARAAIPTPRGGVAGGVLDGQLWMFGGEGNGDAPSGVFDAVEAYDPLTDTWQTLPPMLVPRHGLGAAVLDGTLYLPGGATSQGLSAVDEHTRVR